MKKLANKFMSKYGDKLDSIRSKIIDDDYRYFIQMIIIPALFSIVSLGMCILNIITNVRLLAICTGIFSLVCAIEAILTKFFLKKHIKIAFVWFFLNVAALFTYFILFGGTDGFSTIWLLLIPAFLSFFIGKKGGTIGSFLIFLELVFFFWIPFGRSLLICDSYTDTFLLRFPIIYVVAFIIGLLLEVLREITYKQLKKVESAYHSISIKDSLTGIYNRYWLDTYMSDYFKFNVDSNFGIMILDIDNFKLINDTYGHLVGDMVLKHVASLLLESKSSSCIVSRWGGEEFVVVCKCTGVCEKIYTRAEKIRTLIENANFTVNDNQNLHITVSIGITSGIITENMNFEHILGVADQALYQAKNEGKNKTVHIPF